MGLVLPHFRPRARHREYGRQVEIDEPRLDNRTEFAAYPQMLLDVDGEKLVTVVKATFEVKDGDLERHMGRRYPRTQTVRRAGTTKNAAFHAGRAAGQGIVLNKPMTSGSWSRGRLLGPG